MTQFSDDSDFYRSSYTVVPVYCIIVLTPPLLSKPARRSEGEAGGGAQEGARGACNTGGRGAPARGGAESGRGEEEGRGGGGQGQDAARKGDQEVRK